jgi:hypothetical protein
VQVRPTLTVETTSSDDEEIGPTKQQLIAELAVEPELAEQLGIRRRC